MGYMAKGHPTGGWTCHCCKSRGTSEERLPKTRDECRHHISELSAPVPVHPLVEAGREQPIVSTTFQFDVVKPVLKNLLRSHRLQPRRHCHKCPKFPRQVTYEDRHTCGIACSFLERVQRGEVDFWHEKYTTDCPCCGKKEACGGKWDMLDHMGVKRIGQLPSNETA